MSNEQSPILTALRSARLANEAAIHAIIAVEQMLTIGDGELETVEDDITDDKCKHENATTVNTMTGSFLICECGEQIDKEIND